MLEPLERFFRRVGCLILLDRAADPAVNGHVQRNGTHIKVFSGGAVRNLSDVGASPAHTHASHTGIGTGDHHAQLHAAAHQPAGGDAMAVDAAAAIGSLRTLGTTALKAAAGDHTHSSSGAVTRAGGNTTETSTTSTTAVDLFSVAALNIGAATTIFYSCNGRKSSGAADYAGQGLKLNTTEVGPADPETGAGGFQTGAANAAENGGMWAIIGPRVTSYDSVGLGGRSLCSTSSTGALVRDSSLNGLHSVAVLPIATITNFVIRGTIGATGAGQTLFGDDLNIYTFATS